MRNRCIALLIAALIALSLPLSLALADETPELPAVAEEAEAYVEAEEEDVPDASFTLPIEEEAEESMEALPAESLVIEGAEQAEAAEEVVENLAQSLEEAPEIGEPEDEMPEIPDVAEVGAEAIPEDAEVPEPTLEPTAEPVAVPLTDLRIDASVKLGAGETFRLTITAAPANHGEKLYLASDNAAVAAVAQNGTVTAVAPGATIVRVKSTLGKTAQCAVTVAPAPRKLKLKKSSASVVTGSTYKVKVKFSPSGSYSSRIKYTTSNKKVAKVNAKGVITAVSRGSATIKAKTYNGKTAKFKVRVYNNPTKQMRGLAKDKLGILFMNIGRNDGILLGCGGEYAFIDAGNRAYGAEARDYMKRLGIRKLKYYIGTHAHSDHVGGAATILASIPAKYVVVPHGGVISAIRKGASTAKERSAAARANYRVMQCGQTIPLGRAKLACIGPVRIVSARPKSSKENDNSLVLRVTFGKSSVLLTGDATGRELTQIKARNAKALRVDVLKNPHHNADMRGAYKWFHMKHTVISTASSDLPSSSMMSTLRGLKSKVYITSGNRNGNTLMISDGKSIKFYPTK